MRVKELVFLLFFRIFRGKCGGGARGMGLNLIK
jgi:hypothetical protein